MLPLATAAQMKELDRRAIEERGIPSLELMDRAAQGLAVHVREIVDKERSKCVALSSAVIFARSKSDEKPTAEEKRQMKELEKIVTSKNRDKTPRVAIFCGPGNNGGDGIAAALYLGGYHVRVFLVGDRVKMTPDARAMEERLAASGGVLEDFTIDMTSQESLADTLSFEQQKITTWLSTCDCMVDALFGIGLTRPAEGPFLTAIRLMNGRSCPVVACDIPSGVHADTGEVLGEAVRAKATITFTRPKPGLYMGEGGACAGEVRVMDIGIPRDLEFELDRQGPSICAVDDSGSPLPRRPRTAHKGDFGKIFILAGSEGYTGAPVLAARAALRAGAGLVYLGVPRDIYPIVAVKCDEAMPFPLSGEYAAVLEKARGCDVAVIGPGLGRAPETERLVLSLLADLNIPVVLDADGINALAGHIDILDKRSGPTVLTPHEGEFARLTGCSLPVKDRLSAARDFARDHGCILVLKGHGTVTAAPDGSACINASGNPGMAKGGSGDVLAGMVAALLGQRHLVQGRDSQRELVVARAVQLHGLAGDLCARKLGEYAMLPTDLIEALPEILNQYSE